MAKNIYLVVHQWHKFLPCCAKCGRGWATDAVFCCLIRRVVMQATFQRRARGIESLPTSFETHRGRRKGLNSRVLCSTRRKSGPVERLLLSPLFSLCFLSRSAAAEWSMAEAMRNWSTWFAVGALTLGACGGVCAQTMLADPAPLQGIQIEAPPSGSLAGRLTDLQSAPLAGVWVVLHNQATGAEVRAVTAKNGGFRFAELDAGEYTLEADEPQLGHGRLEGILVTGGMEARVQAAMQFEPAALELVEAAAPGEIATPARAAATMPLEAYAAPGAARPAATASAAPSSAAMVPAAVRSEVAAPGTPQSAPVSRVPEPQVLDSRVPDSRVSGPAPALPPATVSRAALNTESPPSTARLNASALSTVSPEIVASLATQSMRTMNPIPRDAEAARPSGELAAPQPVAPQPAAARAEVLTASATLPAPQLRAALETQSIPFEPALAVTLPRTLPLTHSMAPALLPLNMAAASGIEAALLLGQAAPVAAAAQRADPAAAVVATTVTATQLESLPAGGRRWQEFLLDTPAASTSPDETQASYRGSQESAEIMIDGASTTLKFGAGSGSGSRAEDSAGQGADQQSAMRQAWTGGRGFGVSEAAIHEVTAVSGNVEAEGMRSAGGRTSIQTERGGDALHGQGFFFDRQNNWGARNPFTQWVTETAPVGEAGLLATVPVFDNGPTGAPESYTPPDHEIVWGLGMGRPIRRDKLFWFGALDSYHRNDPGLSMVKHPYLEQTPSGCGTSTGCAPTITGLFAQPSDAQLQLLSAQLDLPSASPVDEALTAYSCMLETLAGMSSGSSPNCPSSWPLAGLLGPAPRTAAQWTGFARIDWQAAERHRFTLEGIGADWNAPGGGLTQVSENYGNHSFGSSQASQEWLLARWEAYLTPNLLAVTQGSAGRAILTARPGTPSAFENTFLTVNSYGQLPQIVVDSRYGFTIGNPSRFGQGSYPDEKLYHAQEMLDWVHNKALIKAGFELDHNNDATSFLRNETGTFTYSKVQNFISDALVFQKFGQIPSGWQNTPTGSQFNEHNCDPANDGKLTGALPCYSYFSQMMGPTNWHLSTNDWAGYATAQWQLSKFVVFSGGLRWEREQLPPPIAALANPELTSATQTNPQPPFSANLPSLGNNWGPRVSVAVSGGKRWPVLRLGYGMYYGRVENATIETALTQTGSFNGDLYFFIKPTDGYTSIDGTSGAPFFPYVFAGEPSSVVKPGVVGFAPNFRNPEVHQAVAAIEQPLPGHVELTASAMLSLGRRLPVFIDTNLDPAAKGTITYTVCDEAPSGANYGACGNLGLGPIKASTITVPFYASWPTSTGVVSWLNPDYQEIDQITSKANSTYEAAMVRLTRYGSRGLSLHAHYTYAHATDWNPNESPMDPTDFSQEYGTSNLDVRHSAAAMLIYEAPWKLHNFAGRVANGWMLSSIGQFHSGLPYTMRVTGSLPECAVTVGAGVSSCAYAGLNPTTSNATITGLRPSINGTGGDNRVYWEDSDSLIHTVGRNTFRYPGTWKADLRLGKKFDLGEMRQLEILAESFNLFNHQNVTEIETTGYTIDSGSPNPTLNFLTGLKTSATAGPIPGFGQPLNINATNFYRERQIQIGLRMRF
jgi:hypothetical protein